MALFKRELSEGSQEILRKSMDFESNVISMVKRSERRAWTVALGSLVLSLLMGGAIAYMLPLKEKVPYLVTVDLKRSTSTISPLRDDIAATGIYASEALNRSHVARFVQAREGYDYDTINEYDWEYVASMSNDAVKNLFVRQFDGTNSSPEKMWGRDTAIRVKITSIILNGLDEERGAIPTGATVRFEKWKFDKKFGKSEFLSSHVATMLPQELKAMGEDKQILLVEGMAHPVMSDKIRYFKEAAFKDRLFPKVEVPALVLAAERQTKPSPAPVAASPSAPWAVEAFSQALPADTPSAQESLARQAVADIGKVASPPAEYTGLAGIGGEIDAMLAQLER